MSWAAPDVCNARRMRKAARAEDRVVVATGDRGWCFANREAAASAETTCACSASSPRCAPQAPLRHDSTTGAMVSAGDIALLLPPKGERDPGHGTLGHSAKQRRRRASARRRRCWNRTRWVVQSGCREVTAPRSREKRSGGGGPWCADRGPAARFRLRAEACARRNHRRTPVVDRVYDLSRVDPLEVNRRNPKVGMSELPLNNRQRDPFVRHLDRMSMPELVRRESSADPSLRRESAQLTPRGGC